MPVITAETAREMAAKSQEARRKRKEAESKPPAMVFTMPQIAGNEAGSISEQYRMRAIQRLVEQMEAVDDRIDAASDPDDFHKLTTARSKLFEQWRILSGIPMPGSRKPAADKPQRQRGTFVDPT